MIFSNATRYDRLRMHPRHGAAARACGKEKNRSAAADMFLNKQGLAYLAIALPALAISWKIPVCFLATMARITSRVPIIRATAMIMQTTTFFTRPAMMKLTKDGKALYLHCLPADISGLSCPEGEVDNSVFDRYLVPLYKQASYKPYIIAAMIFLAQVKDPVKALMDLDSADNKRKMF